MEIGAYKTQIAMLGCEAGGGVFAVSQMTAMPDIDVTKLQAVWQQAMLNSMAASTYKTGPYDVKGASRTLVPVRLQASGRRPDGSAIQAQAIWFVHGDRLYHAVMYQNALNAEAADTFFSGLKFQ